MTRNQDAALFRDLVIDRTESTPPVDQIRNVIRTKIASAQLPIGARMPSVRALAKTIGVTAATVSRAYAALQAEGLLASASGVGTTVADLHDLERSARHSIVSSGAEALDAAIARMRGLGLSDLDVRMALAAKMNELSQDLELVFVAARGSSIDDYTNQLRTALADMPVRVSPLLFEDVESGSTSAKQQVLDADMFLTVLPYMRRVKTALGDLPAEVMILLIQLSLPAAEALLSIPPNAPVLLVTTPSPRMVAVELLQSHGLRDNVIIARDLSVDGLRAASAAADYVVHSTDTAALVADAALSRPTTSLRFGLRPDSVERLRDHLREVVTSSSHPVPRPPS